jgi:CRISPR-associated exonuclease Cas4
MHDKADDPYADETRCGVPVVRSARLASRALGLCGVADIIEFHPDDAGMILPRREGRWRPLIIEYKRGASKSSDCDRLQLAAQVMAFEEMHGIVIDSAALFYGTPRRREIVSITQDLRNSVRDTALEMHRLFESRAVARPEKSPSCAACSLYDICRPDTFGKSAAKYIRNLLDEETA